MIPPVDASGASFAFAPLAPPLWPALEDLFGPERGASGGCWCLWPRMTSAEFQRGSRDSRKTAFRALVDAGMPTGILAFDGDTAVGWCGVAPRPDLSRMQRSRVTGPEGPSDGVWLIHCFYVRRGHRRQGLMARLVEAATTYARDQGARAVEACPIEPARRLQWGEGFVGIASAYAGLGFREVVRRSATRPLLRKDLRG